jgi:hypothetical protein
VCNVVAVFNDDDAVVVLEDEGLRWKHEARGANAERAPSNRIVTERSRRASACSAGKGMIEHMSPPRCGGPHYKLSSYST